MKKTALIATILASALAVIERPTQSIMLVLFNHTGQNVGIKVTKAARERESITLEPAIVAGGIPLIKGGRLTGKWITRAIYEKKLTPLNYCWIDTGWSHLRLEIGNDEFIRLGNYKVTDTLCFNITKSGTKFHLSEIKCGPLSLPLDHRMQEIPKR